MLTISVIIPAKNAAIHLRSCLNSLFAAGLLNAECIVVDDASDDDTARVAESFGVLCMRNDQCRGPAFSRNRGAAAATGDVLLFLDADTTVHADVVERVGKRFAKEPELDALVGSYDNAPADPGFVSVFRNLFHCFVHQHGELYMDSFWTGCGAIRRSVFEGCGGFSVRYRKAAIEDVEFGYRLASAGRQIQLDRQLQVKHLKRWTFWGLINTDIFSRGIPWTLLAMRTGRLPDNLVTRTSERFCVAFTALFIAGASVALASFFAGAASTYYSIAIVIALLSLAGFLILNRSVLQFFNKIRGWRFALAVVPMLLIYHCCNLFSIACALCLYIRDPKLRAPEAAPASAPASQNVRAS